MVSKLVGALAVASFAAAGGAVHNAVAAETDVNVLDYGAAADGTADSTTAFQKAIDSVKETGGRVYVPAGSYVVGELRMHPGVTVQGVAGYGFRGEPKGTRLRLRKDETSRCMFDFTGSTGAAVRDLAMLGDLDVRLQAGQGAPEAAAKTARRVHGVALLKKDFGDHEDYPLVLDVGVEE